MACSRRRSPKPCTRHERFNSRSHSVHLPQALGKRLRIGSDLRSVKRFLYRGGEPWRSQIASRYRCDANAEISNPPPMEELIAQVRNDNLRDARTESGRRGAGPAVVYNRRNAWEQNVVGRLADRQNFW